MFNNLLSVIVISHTGSFDKTKFCLKALLEQKTKIPFEIIVVNDGFDEKISNLIETYKKYLDLKYFERENDMCVSLSRNIGANNSKAKYLVFIDSDIILNPLALNHYYNLLSENKNTSIWGEFHSQGEKDIRLAIENKEFEKYINHKDNLILYFKPFNYCFSASFAIEKEIYHQIGGFCEEFVGYGYEDKEFAYRLYKNRIKFLFNKDVSALHLGNPLGVSDFYNKNRIDKNNKILLKKMFEDIKKFYFLDEKIVLKEFEYVHKLMGDTIYIFYIIYFLSINNEAKALEYTKIAEKFLDKDTLSKIWQKYIIKKQNKEIAVWY